MIIHEIVLDKIHEDVSLMTMAKTSSTFRGTLSIFRFLFMSAVIVEGTKELL